MLIASMREYFREALTASLRSAPVPLTDTAQAYLVNLLTEFARAENVFAGTDRGETPVFADMLGRAQDAEPQEAVRIYKHMGDSSLYLSGFFAEGLEKKPVGVSYYVSIGGSAYAQVSDLMRPLAGTSAALFAELSDRFRSIVDLLTAMSLHGERTQKLDDAAVLQLVERYQRTGKREVLEALQAQGVVLRPGVLHNDDDPVN